MITGASGGEQYAKKYDAWRTAFTTTLREKFHYPPERIIVLGGVRGRRRRRLRRARTCSAALGDLRARMTKDDQLLVLLIGHGTSTGRRRGEVQSRRPRPERRASGPSSIRPIPGRLVFVDTTAASFPFLRQLAGRGRIVLTATDSRGAAVRDGVRRILREGVRRSGRRRRQERPRLDLGSVQLRERRRAAVVRAEGPAADRASAARRHRRRDRAARRRTPAPTARIARITYLEPDAPWRCRPIRRRPRWSAAAPNSRRSSRN